MDDEEHSTAVDDVEEYLQSRVVILDGISSKQSSEDVKEDNEANEGSVNLMKLSGVISSLKLDEPVIGQVSVVRGVKPGSRRNKLNRAEQIKGKEMS